MPKLTKQREDYLYQFEQEVTKLAPQFTGKIDWNAALNFYFIKKPIEEAAAQYVANRTM